MEPFFFFAFHCEKKAPALFRSENRPASLFAMAMASRAVVTAYLRSPDDALLRLHTGRAKRGGLVNDGRHMHSDAQVSQSDGPAGPEELPSQAPPSEEERRSLVACFTVQHGLVLDSTARPSFIFLEEIDRLINH